MAIDQLMYYPCPLLNAMLSMWQLFNVSAMTHILLMASTNEEILLVLYWQYITIYYVILVESFLQKIVQNLGEVFRRTIWVSRYGTKYSW